MSGAVGNRERERGRVGERESGRERELRGFEEQIRQKDSVFEVLQKEKNLAYLKK